ncbi:MAG: 4-hydroxy-3-methylbut-2-enyl diphosphate reductase, partial [Leucobacter sp.]|nr:4-hydroxy-3-methylbut-2-enyl diphosphate reductase [Leucobacter sp.]
MPRLRRQAGRLQDLPVAGEKQVLLAAPRGYCAGVDRAVVAVEQA